MARTKRAASAATPKRSPYETYDPAVHLLPNIDTSGGPDACHLWMLGASGSNGYGRLWKIEGFPAPHRKAWEQFNCQALDKGANVLHSCNTKLCCNGLHLYNGTRKQNVADSMRAGTHAKRKLTAALACEIASLRGTGLRFEDVAPRYDVTPNTIHRIWNGLRWAKATGLGKGQDARTSVRRLQSARPEERRIAS